MSGLKVVTFWVRPQGEGGLPEAGDLLEGLLYSFHEFFPEYEGCLIFSQSPRLPRHVFVYARDGCSGVLPAPGRHLQGLLEKAFPEAEVKPYGKAWVETGSAP